jgi:hypothetical protein
MAFILRAKPEVKRQLMFLGAPGGLRGLNALNFRSDQIAHLLSANKCAAILHNVASAIAFG